MSRIAALARGRYLHQHIVVHVQSARLAPCGTVVACWEPPMLLHDATLKDWLRIIRAEYLEVPGLHLTKAQIRRLWGLDVETCDRLLDALLESRFLRRTKTDRYARRDSDS